MKQDLFAGCNDQGVNEKEFMQMFCNVCKNRSCERAGWASSRWDSRISTQVDRLLLNPNIVSKEGTKWEELPDFEGLAPSGVVAEVWGKPPKIETPPSFMVESVVKEALPNPAVVKEALPSPAVVKEALPNPAPIQGHSILNTPTSSSGIMIGGGSAPSPAPPKPAVDEWAVTPPKLKVGGTFKMGN